MPPAAQTVAAVAGSLTPLSTASGLPLDAFNPEHVRRQIEAILQAEGASDIEDIALLLSRSAAARERFRRSVAISASGHRRDPHQFELLRDEVFPEVTQREGVIRVWSAGCADGSELYDLATMLDRAGVLERSYLLGSDILEENLAQARAKQSVIATPRVRARVRWEHRDLASEPAPPGRWALILCRNVAIYMRPEVRDKLHARLADALVHGGFLMLGRSERIRNPQALGLETVGANVYRRPL